MWRHIQLTANERIPKSLYASSLLRQWDSTNPKSLDCVTHLHDIDSIVKYLTLIRINKQFQHTVNYILAKAFIQVWYTRTSNLMKA